MASPFTIRVHWSGMQGRYNANIIHTDIKAISAVHISASEAGQRREDFTDTWYDRFVGDAIIWVSNVAPQDGVVSFVVHVDWPSPLDVVADITVFDKPIVLFEFQIP